MSRAKHRLGRSELKSFTEWNDGGAETALNFKFYRSAAAFAFTAAQRAMTRCACVRAAAAAATCAAVGATSADCIAIAAACKALLTASSDGVLAALPRRRSAARTLR
jgi:hypothetical protein